MMSSLFTSILVLGRPLPNPGVARETILAWHFQVRPSRFCSQTGLAWPGTTKEWTPDPGPKDPDHLLDDPVMDQALTEVVESTLCDG